MTDREIADKYRQQVDEIMDACRPFAIVRKADGGSSKGGIYYKPVTVAQKRMQERDQAVGALKMIAGEIDHPDGLKGHRDIARDALTFIRQTYNEFARGSSQ